MRNDLHKAVRIKNRSLNRWEQYYRKAALQSFPVMIQLPTGTSCNIKCRFCTDRSAGSEYDYGNLSLNECRSVIEKGGWGEALQLVESIDLYGWGEPLCNPDYESIFDYLLATYPGLGVNIVTNGILFKRNWIDRMVGLENSIVNFSVNAATAETYLKLTGSRQFDAVIGNIRSLIETRSKKNSRSPYVSLSYVATTENIAELAQFVDLAADLRADCIKVQDVMILNRETEELSLINQPELAYEMFEGASERARKRKIQIWFYVFHQVDYFHGSEETEHRGATGTDYGIDDEETASGIGSPTVPSPYFDDTDCFEPWEAFQVTVDGEVWPCCRFQNVPGASLGNVHEQSFQEIWNGQAYQSLRERINTDDPPHVCAICPRKLGLDQMA